MSTSKLMFDIETISDNFDFQVFQGKYKPRGEPRGGEQITEYLQEFELDEEEELDLLLVMIAVRMSSPPMISRIVSQPPVAGESAVLSRYAPMTYIPRLIAKKTHKKSEIAHPPIAPRNIPPRP